MPVSSKIVNGLAAGVVDHYAEAERVLLARMAKSLAKGIDGPNWAKEKLAEVHTVQANAKTLLKNLESTAGKSIDGALTTAARRGYASAGASLIRAVDVKVNPLVSALPGTRALTRLVAETTDKVTGMHPRILRSTMDAYRSIIAQSAGQVLLGTETRLTATQAALDAFAKKGVTGLIDSSGRGWDMASYSEMAVRTSTAHAAIAAHLDRLQAEGMDLVIVSASPRTCDICAPWEGKVLSVSGASTGSDVDGTLEEATGAGLFHPNCTHSVDLYQPGITQPIEPTEDPQAYADEQKLRGLERLVRAEKRVQAVALDSAAAKKAEMRIRNLQAQIRVHVATTGVKRQSAREQISKVAVSDAVDTPKIVHLSAIGADTPIPTDVAAVLDKWVQQGGSFTLSPTERAAVGKTIESHGEIYKGALYRGESTSLSEKEILAKFKVGSTHDFQASSFSTEFGNALPYAENMSGGSTQVVYEVTPSYVPIKVLNVADRATLKAGFAEDERIAQGPFYSFKTPTVDSDGTITVYLKQAETTAGTATEYNGVPLSKIIELSKETYVKPSDRFDINYTGDIQLKNLFSKLSYDGLPTLVDQKGFDAAAKEGHVLYRGLHNANRYDETATVAPYIEAFKTGDYYAGLGVYGNGTYTTGSLDRALFYARKDPSAVISMVMPKSAKTISEEALAKIQEAIKTQLLAIRDAEALAGDKASIIGVVSSIEDPGRLAAMLGYDAIDITSEYGDQYFVVLNRSILKVLDLPKTPDYGFTSVYDGVPMNKIFDTAKKVAESPSTAPLSKLDPQLGALYDAAGYNGPPTLVDEEGLLQATVMDGGTLVFRGVEAKDGITAESMMSDFKTGDYFVGNGMFGNGTYAATDMETAQMYAVYKDENILSIVIPKDAKLISREDIFALAYKVRDELETAYAGTSDIAQKESIMAVLHVVEDPGRLATMLGYDAIVATKIGGVIPGPDGAYFAILNRSILKVLK